MESIIDQTSSLFTNRRDVKENDDAIPHEPEMIKAYRDFLVFHKVSTHI